MMNNKFFVVLFLVSVFISSCSQIALKKSANKEYENKLKMILNPLVVGAYFFFFGASVMTTLSYRGVDLSLGPVLEATSYVYIVILSCILLKEKITFKKIIGNLIIVMGIIIYTLGK